jgi:V/A-type H+-transporting ATPase subunit I
MIVPMKKITVLSLAAHRDETLEALRELGAIHVSPLQAPTTGDVESARRQLDEARSALANLERAAQDAPAPEAAGAREPDSPAALLQEATGLAIRMRDRKDRLQRLDEQIQHLAPLGDFDPAQLRDLLHHGVACRLFKSEPKAVFEFPPEAVYVELQRDKTVLHFALLNATDWSAAAALEIQIPERSLADLRHERGRIAAEQAEDGETLLSLTPLKDRVAEAVGDVESRLRWLETRDGMAAEGPLLLLQGYMPARDMPRLEADAKQRGWGWLAEEPAESDPVPTLISSSRWVRPIHLLFDMLGILPGYREVDVSAIFMVFFSLFFAMLVGDAVYGLIFLGLSVVIHKKWKAAPRQLTPLLVILSVSTIVWGVLTGSYLGIENIPAPLKALRIDWLTDSVKIQTFCFLIGAIHMTVAHAWNVWRLRKHGTALSHVGWICSCWAMYAYANFLVLGLPLMPGAAILLGIGVVLILGFTVPLKDIRKEFASLLTLPLSIIGNFGDVVSYLRLYLVGSASVVLVKAFNEMVFPSTSANILLTLLGALIIFVVHILNILLSSLAVLVHGVRLNALEFSTHMGIQWLGLKYNPFRKRTSP